MTDATQAVVLNGVPLVALAAAYAAVTVAVVPALWRDRGSTHPLDWAVVLVFPAIAFTAGVFGVLVFNERRSLGGHVWFALAATLAAFLPVLPILVRWRERAFLAGGVSRSLVAEERASSRDRELAAVSQISVALSRARLPLDVARPLAAHVAKLLRVGFVGVVLVDEEDREAHGVYAELSGKPAVWWTETTVDLRTEPSGIARAYLDRAPLTVYDVEASSLVSPRLAAIVGARSGAWVPMVTDERVVGVIALATTDDYREFAPEELSVLQAVAAEAALAFERLRSAVALAEALDREKRAAEIVRRLRAELDPEGVVRVARDELTAALSLASITIDVSGDQARVDVERANPLTEGELALVEIVRYEIGAAVRIAGLLADSSRQARVQRGFYRIASLLGEPVSPAEAYDAAAQAAAESLGGDFAAVLARGAGGLVFVGGHELPPELRELPIPQSFADAADDGQMLAAPELARDGRFSDAWRQASFSSLLAIPVRGAQSEVVVVFFEAEHSFSQDDLELAQQVARAARGALERSRLFDAERTSRSLAQQLARTGSLLATELDPAAVLDAVVTQAVDLLRVEAAALTSLHERELVITAASGEGVENVIGARSPLGASAAGDVVRSRAPAVYEDVSQNERLREADILLAAGNTAYLGVPLNAPDGDLYGILSVYGRSPRVWREEEVQALLALAANAAAALTNAELYQRVAVEREQSVAILSNIADGIVAVDRDGHVVLWNNAAEEITGVPAGEAVGRTPAQVLQRELESDAGGTNRLVAITRGEDDVWLSLSETVMRDPTGAVAGRIFAFRDISAEHELEQMKTDFVSTVSVELRTPLTSIYGFAQTLLREDVGFSEVERRTFLEFIARESEGLTAIVDALLNAARLDKGDLLVELSPTDVVGVVHSVVDTAASHANGHRFVADVDGSPGRAHADPAKLRQVLDQLVANAVKFSPGGGTVTVSVERRADAIEIAVADEGVGIQTGDVDRIFSKFTKVASGPGTGLGLFIARGLVREMGGRMWVESTEGVGARFVFALAPVEDV
ncbi:MAG TPA: GAF domain-containing protein [Gaiellaceae bacterium]|nr:GAF domain-containing protein [Gaiellaceae bacterium]